MKRLLLAAAAIASMSPVAAAAQTGDAARGLVTLRELNLVVLGDLATQQHVEGKAHVGGNLSGRLVAAQGGAQGYQTSARAQLTVGGSAEAFTVEPALGTPIAVRVGGNAANMGLNGAGTVSVGGIANVQNFNPNASKQVRYGMAATGYQPQDSAYVLRDSSLTALSGQIAQETAGMGADLRALSARLASLQPLSTITSTAAALNYSGATGGYAVFAMTAAAFQDQNANFDRLFSALPAGMTTVINVAGTALVQGGNLNLTGINRSVIWNFAGATSLTLKGWHGSVLAPDAFLTNTSAVEGSVVARAMRMDGEVHLGTFNGTSAIVAAAPVPEPATWAAMVAGFGLAGVALRRRRAGTAVPAA